MDKQLSPLVLGFLLALGGACGGDSKPTKPSTNPVDKDDDNDDDDETGMDASARDAGSGGGNNNRDASGGGNNGGNNRDASNGGGNNNRDASSGINGNRDSGGPTSAPDAAGGGPDLTPVACDTSKAPTIPPLALQPVVTGLERLTFAAQPPGSSDWYLVQQTGQIRIFRGGQLMPGAFLDVSSDIALTTSALFQDERGLLGLAFAPDYATSGKFYVMLTPTSGGGMNRDTIREYQRSDDPNKANPMPTKTLLQLPASELNHNGGNIITGPDGMLYIGTGDGGGMCNSNKPNEPQDVASLFGKILRLDPNGSAPNYAAAGNPFASGGDPRVLHLGVRNPFRFGFDRMTGDLYIGDVGETAHEDVSVVGKDAKGLNFGWPAFEGKQATSQTCAGGRGFQLRSGSEHTPPIFETSRTDRTGPYADWISVIGGRVYRGAGIPGLRGMYLTGDYEGARMIALMHCGGATSKETAILKNPDPNSPNALALMRPSGAPVFRQLTAILEDNDGELYLLANFSTLYKIVARQ